MTPVNVSLASIFKLIGAEFRATGAFKQVQDYDQLAEAIAECPLLQIYPEDGEGDNQGQTDRTSFNGDIRSTQTVLNLDVYARQRSELMVDVREQVRLLDVMTDVLQAQPVANPFGSTAIKSFHWTWSRVTFDAGTVKYAGIRFVLELVIY